MITPSVGFGGHFQARGEGFGLREQRVVAAHLKLLRHAGEDADAAVPHGGRLAVHGIVEHAQLPAESFHDTLQAQTHSEHRHAQPDGGLHHAGHAEIFGAPGSGRDQDHAGRHLRNQLRRKSGAIGHDLRAGLARVVGQGVDEAIVVVHQQQFHAGARRFPHHRRARLAAATSAPIVRKKPVAFRRVSRSSMAGTES